MECPECGTELLDSQSHLGLYFCPNCEIIWDASDVEDDNEALSVDEAADIWRSHGMDEDYMFGYTEDELRNA